MNSKNNFNSESEKIGVGSLVAPRPILEHATKQHKKIVYFTISSNAKTAHKDIVRQIPGVLKKRTIKTPYYLMTHKEQYDYLMKYFETAYMPTFDPQDKAVVIFEINEQNNLHIHGLLVSDQIQDDYEIQCFRKTIYTNPMMVLNFVKTPTRGNDKPRQPKDWMNNIVFADDPLKTYDEYFTKQTAIKRHYPDLVFNI